MWEREINSSVLVVLTYFSVGVYVLNAMSIYVYVVYECM